MSELIKLPELSIKSVEPIMGPNFSEKDFAPIKLDKDTLASIGIRNESDLKAYLERHRQKHEAVWLTGGYLEQRALYQSSLFTSGNQAVRDIHLGIDIWGDSGSEVYCPINGHIHSFAYNDNLLDYGYTLIISHRISNIPFYTLYGHLSSDYWNTWKKGARVNAGDCIARLGEKSENGGWIPHLHFQLIINIEDYEGDYPGVCSNEDLEYYKENCPNPSLLIKKTPSS